MSDARDGVTPSKCPTCNYHVDAASPVDGSSGRPSAGDITLCLRCGEILVFTEKMAVDVATADDLAPLDSAARALVKRAQNLIRTHDLVRRRERSS